MHPLSPMLTPRLAREDCTIKGFDIPSGTGAHVSIWTIGRDPEIWDCPDQFCPERSLRKSIDVKGQDFEVLVVTIWVWQRMSPGYSLGLKLIKLTLANLLHGFKWRLSHQMLHKELKWRKSLGPSSNSCLQHNEMEDFECKYMCFQLCFHSMCNQC